MAARDTATEPPPPAGYTLDPEPPAGYTLDPQVSRPGTPGMPGTETRGLPVPPGTEARPAAPRVQPQASRTPGQAAGDIAAGIAQGVISLPPVFRGETPTISRYMPPSQPAIQAGEALRQRAGASGYGKMGEFAGSVLPWTLVPEAAAPTRIERIFRRSTLPAIAQPTDPNLSGRDAAIETLLQGALGTGIGEFIRGGGKAADWLLRQQSERKAAEDLATKIRRANEMRGSLFDFSKRVQAAHEAERDKEVKAIQEHYKTQKGQREELIGQLGEEHAQQITQRDAAIEALNQQHQAELERVARDYRSEQARVAGEKATQADIPNQTTLQWHRETLATIGKEAEAPTVIATDTANKVRKKISDELNRIRGQMSLEGDGLDRFKTATRLTARQTAQQIGGPFQAGWRDRYRTYVATPLMTQGRMTGKKLADWISGMNDEAESLARRASNAPESDRAPLEVQRDALRKIADNAEAIMLEGDPKLAQELANAKRGYMLWSIGQGSGGPEKLGMMTPADIVKHWSARMGHGPAGDARYLAAMSDPKNPNSRLMRWLDTQVRAHGRDIPKAIKGDVPPAPGRPGGAALPPEIPKPGEPPELPRPGERGGAALPPELKPGPTRADFPEIPGGKPPPGEDARTSMERAARTAARHAARIGRHAAGYGIGGWPGVVASVAWDQLPRATRQRIIRETLRGTRAVAPPLGKAASPATGYVTEHRRPRRTP